LGSAESITLSPVRNTSPRAGLPLALSANGGNILCAAVPASQRPSLAMPMGTTSYFAGSSAEMTEAAEISETSCSPERPPNRMPTRSFFFSVVISLGGNRSAGVSPAR
jgi:hypothetical protein